MNSPQTTRPYLCMDGCRALLPAAKAEHHPSPACTHTEHAPCDTTGSQREGNTVWWRRCRPQGWLRIDVGTWARFMRYAHAPQRLYIQHLHHSDKIHRVKTITSHAPDGQVVAHHHRGGEEEANTQDPASPCILSGLPFQHAQEVT